MRMWVLGVAAALWAPVAVWAADVAAPMSVSGVEVFPNGAVMTLSAEVDLPAGASRLHALVPAFVGQSGTPRPRVTGAEVAGIAQTQNDQFAPESFDTELQANARAAVRAAEDNLRAAQAEVLAVDEAQSALDAKANLLTRAGAGGDVLPDADALVALADRIAAALTQIATDRAALDDARPGLEAEVVAARAALSRAETALAVLTPPDGDWQLLTLDIVSEDAGRVAVALDLPTPNAGWSVAYDVRLDEATDAITLDRLVTLSQQSGLAWTNAALRLSTARPDGQIAATPVGPTIPRIRDARPVLRSAEADVSLAPMVMAEAAPAFGGFVAQTDGPVLTYTLARGVDVPSGAGQVQIALPALELSAERYVAAAPRFDDTAYVMADLDNTSGEMLLPGEARLFRDARLIGTGRFPQIAAGDAATLGFGPERDIAVEVTFLDQQEGDRGIIRGRNTRQDRLRVTARNLGDTPHDLRLRYAVPVSQQEDLVIAVDMDPAPDARNVEDLPGVMEWALTLAPGATQDIAMTFDLRWPEDEVLDWRP